ncbi:zinc-ribbon domain-containing protein [Xanthobacteraceae bacterium Astr-EGSB]|uniref:MJ0042-type zinc finger domain-containing protein n=1 Tax=Astrobacterium formosum TaxID=3069710 RepID=UPI0027B1F949|nr:zinc-ribbon domain-containing protein [Xanthobacteraceae bacterium Astr-EGSB]
MKIVCPNCTTSYEVTAAAIGEAGRSVRCVHCKSIWFVPPVQPEPEPVAEPVTAQASAPAAPKPAPAAASADLDDMAAWGLSDEPEETPAGADMSAAMGAGMGAAEPAFDAGAMLADIEGPIAVTGSPPLAPVDAWPVDAWPVDGDDPWKSPADEQVFLRPGDKPRRKFKLKAPSLATIASILAAILIGLVIWRGDVVRVMPQMASLYGHLGLPVNLRGLAIEDVRVSKDTQDGITVLVVEGRVVNVSRLLLEVPRLRLALRNAAGAEIYSWTSLPTRPILGPGDLQPFRSRLASPPGDGKDVLVRFFNRRDAMGGLK